MRDLFSGRPPPPSPGGGPPPGADTQLWYWFSAVDTDKSGQLSVDELQRALVNGDWSPFNIETVRTMVNMFDKGKNYLHRHLAAVLTFLYNRQHRHN